MTDIIRPSNVRVRLARKRRALQARQLRKVALEVRGSERAEVAANSALALDNHQPLLLALELVDLHGFEEVGGAGGQDGFGGVAEAAGEGVDGHDGAVDGAVVAGEEEVHVIFVADDG